MRMDSLVAFIDDIFAKLEGVNFALLVAVDLAAFGAACLVCLVACAAHTRLRFADKRPFFHFVNAFAALTLALFLLRYELPRALVFSVAVWLVGYLVYGILCALTRRVKTEEQPPVRIVTQSVAPAAYAPPAAPPAHSTVRLEHALSICEKLLAVNLGRGDRQEIGKMKTALTLLKVKGTLSPEDGEALNEMFNALLKLMARYDL